MMLEVLTAIGLITFGSFLAFPIFLLLAIGHAADKIDEEMNRYD